MDYMLLKDGSVITIEGEPKVSVMYELFKEHGGVAQYWTNEHAGWWYVTNSMPPMAGGKRITDDEVPEVIRLAAMLE